ncbi:MAG: hypothetical protein Q9181_007769 [Wetmoreana brouardii]
MASTAANDSTAKSPDSIVKSFHEWLANHGQSTSSTTATLSSSTDSGSWSVPILSYGNNNFYWYQRGDGTPLFLDFNAKIGTFRVTRGARYQEVSLFGFEERGLGKPSAAVMYTDPAKSPCIRTVFVRKDAKKGDLQTEFRIAKFVASLQARNFVGHLLKMVLLSFSNRTGNAFPTRGLGRAKLTGYWFSENEFKLGLEALLHDMAANGKQTSMSTVSS